MFSFLNISAVTPDSIPTPRQDWSLLKSLPLDDLVNELVKRIVHFGIQLAIAVFVFYLGKFIINKLIGLLTGILHRRKVEVSLCTFLESMVRIALYFILLVTVIGILGIETSSFIALFASAGVAIGMALSGTLQNFAGGVLILLLKPYRVGDYIEVQGYAGTVTEIQIFSTIINTYDNKSIIIPNGGLSTGSINNWSREDYRRVDWSVGISYGDSFEVAQKAILDILRSEPDVVTRYIEDDRAARRAAAGLTEEDGKDTNTCPECSDSPAAGHRSLWRRIFRSRRGNAAVSVQHSRVNVPVKPKVDRSPVVVLDALADSSVNLKVRAWTRSDRFWDVYYRVNQRLYTELPDAGIHFPFPQLDVHIQNSDASQSTGE